MKISDIHLVPALMMMVMMMAIILSLMTNYYDDDDDDEGGISDDHQCGVRHLWKLFPASVIGHSQKPTSAEMYTLFTIT